MLNNQSLTHFSN